MSDSVVVASIPDCDICKSEGVKSPAYADASIQYGNRRTWANVCMKHFNELGGGLGLGRGQRLFLEGETDEDHLKRVLSESAGEADDDDDEYEDPIVDTDFLSREHEAAAKFLADLIRKRDEADAKIPLTPTERTSWNKRIAKASIIMNANAMKAAKR